MKRQDTAKQKKRARYETGLRVEAEQKKQIYRKKVEHGVLKGKK